MLLLGAGGGVVDGLADPVGAGGVGPRGAGAEPGVGGELVAVHPHRRAVEPAERVVAELHRVRECPASAAD